MMQIPEILKPFIEEGKKLPVGAIEFSGGTYQIQVFDKENEAWAFIQLDKNNGLKDCFCSCHDSMDIPGCPHLAAAYLRIFNHHEKPLHERFEISLWNKLCRLYSDENVENTGKGSYVTKSDGKVVFHIQGKTKATIDKLSEIILHRHPETEETSLKFSNLSEEEILLWKQGRPTDELKYELSFWNDLAKWFMLMQEEGQSYKISFGAGSDGIPNAIDVKFPNVEFGFNLSEADLEGIIPSLRTVDSPLKVHLDQGEAIKKISYDQNAKVLHIESKKQEKKEPVGRKIGNWSFVKNKGFYPLQETGLLASSEIKKDQIPAALTENFETIKSRLEGAVLHDEIVRPSYSLDFDVEWNLHISCYLFKEGDLTKPGSADFGTWAYIEGDGFYRLRKRAFDFTSKVIAATDVADFVRKHRHFFNDHDGFKLYLSNVEAEVQFKLDESDKLTFGRRTVFHDKETKSHDFGNLIYVEPQGFYTKIHSTVSFPVRSDIAINKDQIPLFIRKNRHDLEHIPGFFSEKSPVLKSSLDISLSSDGSIKIVPYYDLAPEYQNKNIRFFDDFCYVEDEGFHELPFDSRLPDEYKHPVEILPETQVHFLNNELPKIKSYAHHIDQTLLKPEMMKLKALKITKADKGFYALKAVLETENGLISLSDIWSALKKKKSFLFHPFGLIDLKEKKFDWLKQLDKARVNPKEQVITLSTLEFIRLNALNDIELDESSQEILKELTEFRNPEPPDLTGLNSKLRSYQLIGVNWLWFLYNHSLSGILSDDMGLGKTHQTMALIAAVMNLHKNDSVKKRFLIVCPTSVIYHWQEKLEAFLPNANVYTFHGTDRDLKDFHEEYDVLLTSYGIWRNETEFLSKLPFEVAIFDEIQVAKNHNSRIYSSLIKVNAEMRIGLTGTPIENYLRELKTLFDIVLPSYMPSDHDFREFFVKPIEKEGNLERQVLLTRFIKPFLLRRKKTQVLLDLPEKIEEVAHTELSEGQAKLYNETLEKTRKKILADLQDDKSPIPYMHIFAILSALKQICDHPAVFHKTAKTYKHYHSGKWDLFVELLNEARESRQKVVIFSQYLTMLDIIEEYLNEHNIGYATIRGATVDRGEEIRRFNNDPNCEVFVGSLQASGLGLDLTAGSVVIHYDRWWNAARENQATDRVHRIGQTRGVQVFKLVTKGTVEEKIDKIIARKGKLMEDIVTVDDHQIIKNFDRNELMELLQYVSNDEGLKDSKDI